MKVFLKKKVFNSDMKGRAVHISGYDKEGTEWNMPFLVNDVKDENLLLLDSYGETCTLHVSDFEAGLDGKKLELVFLKVK